MSCSWLCLRCFCFFFKSCSSCLRIQVFDHVCRGSLPVAHEASPRCSARNLQAENGAKADKLGQKLDV